MKLQKKYGFWQILALAISATLGSSILVSFGQVAFQAQFNPILIIIAWILGGLLVLPEMFLLSEGATSYPENGTSYYWIKRAKWNACSFWFGWIMVLFVSATAVATACLAFGNIVMTLLKLENQWYGKMFGILILFALVLMQVLIKKSSGYSQIIFALLKGLPIVLVLIIAMMYGNTGSFTDDTINQNLSQIYLSSFLLLPATAMTMFAYSGMEAITYVSGEVINPRKNIPRAMIIATIMIVILYIILAIGLLTINKPQAWIGPNGFNNVWYYAIMNNPAVPPGLNYLFSILAIFIFVGSLNSFLVYHSRLIFKMSEEKDFFAFFQKTTKRTNMPYLAMLFLVLLTVIYILWTSLFNVTNYFILAVSVLKFITMLSLIYLRINDPKHEPLYRKPLFIILVILALSSCFITFIGSILAMYYYAKNTGNMWELWNCLIVLSGMLSGYPLYYAKKWCVQTFNTRKQKNNVGINNKENGESFTK
ncbi:APC family permease [Spiroplasma citri]|uniref:Amino acid permease n=1 Tax=Spiroplasma citri TaxID=2133 RepID=Q14MS2_SPICI|nr:amino acid permease [Spiroplasma citri]APE75339.1 putative fructoselysine transporter [Spiroplasma citri]QED25229.1 amino acid permease [Spiroplasma citri]QIA67564.1 amino acid permease [Spiroplasma citri]QIA69411.1 amino acid permease [Spiroplasma citri]QIA71275.1 amino acid permease [Spiroplasma citri]